MKATTATRNGQWSCRCPNAVFVWVLGFFIAFGNGRCHAISLATEAVEFSCTNLPASEAISLLAYKTAVPINAIIDTVEEPAVTISRSKGTIAEYLHDILEPMTNFEYVVKSGTILVLPKGLENDPTFPLNQSLSKCDVTYREYSTPKSGRTYGGTFEIQPPSFLNVALPFLPLKHQRPPYEQFPVVRTFTNTTLLDVLTSVSVELHASWSCGRVRPAYVKRYNEEVMRGSGAGHPYWPNEKLPAYCVQWRKGAFHGISSDSQAISPNLFEVQQAIAWKRMRAWSHGGHNAQRSPIDMKGSIVSINSLDAPVELVLRLTNRTDHAVTISNPFRDDTENGFWQVWQMVNANQGTIPYRVSFPSVTPDKEAQTITLAAHQSYERRVDLRHSMMILDELRGYSAAGEPKDKESKTFTVGHYDLSISVYFKGDNGMEYFLSDPTLLTFEIQHSTADQQP